MVVGFGRLFVYKVAVVGAHELHVEFLGQVHQHGVHLLLLGEGLAVGHLPRVFHFVALQLEVIVVTPEALEPSHRLARPVDVALQYLLRHFATEACRAYYQPLAVLLEVFVVGTRTAVEAIDPRTRDELHEVVVARQVLRQHDEVPAAAVAFLVGLLGLAAVSHVHLAPENGLEGFLAFALQLLVHLVAVVVELLHAEHVAVVGDGHTAHAVGYCLVYDFVDGRLAVEDREVRMYMKMNEVECVCHKMLFSPKVGKIPARIGRTQEKIKGALSNTFAGGAPFVC